MEEKNIKSTMIKCLSCGGNLKFCPSEQDLKCNNCGNHYEIKNNGAIETHSFDDLSAHNEQEYKEFVDQNKVFKCLNCGANVILNCFEIAKSCPYCGTALAIDDGHLPGAKPDAVIPFAFDESGAAERFATTIKKRFFAPKKFKRNLPENQVKGIYIPAYAFDTNTHSVYNGELYDEEEETDSEGRTHTERRYFHVSGKHDFKFRDVIVECSSKISQYDIDGVLPYEYGGKQAYKNEYILGYSVEQYNQTVEKSIPTYKQIVESSIKSQILSKYHYDGVSYLNVSTDYDDEKYRYYLLPIYRFDYEYKGKKYVTYMNGQTGKVDNNIPKSGWKIFFAIILPILLFVGIAVLIAVLSSK